MAKYCVFYSMVGCASILIEADSEDDARELAAKRDTSDLVIDEWSRDRVVDVVEVRRELPE